MASNSTTTTMNSSSENAFDVLEDSGTTSSSSPFSLLYDFDFLLLEAKLILSAVGIIYVSAHAALRRPPSAAPKKPRKPGQKADDEDRFSQGLEPSDAILFPLMAAIVLVGLYYLIQWLKDPGILNRILRWYMSFMSIASLLALYAHGMEVITSVVFPSYWRRGGDGVLMKVNQSSKTIQACDDAGNPGANAAQLDNPLPSILSWLAPSQRAKKAVWELRGMLTRQWTIKLFIHGMGKEEGKIKFAHMMGMLLSLATALVYSSTNSTWLANLLGYGMCYGSALLLSPTDFLTGSLVLIGLFFYDIVMVFYTPYMVTVATKLEAPIKLTFQAAERKNILGLGDIVIPGMVIALALRFDLWRHYARRIKYEPTPLTLIEKDAASGQVVTREEVKHREVKPTYADVKGLWGERFWVRRRMFLARPQILPPALAAVRFPKTYFYAGLAGYLLGMIVTLAMLLVFQHGQPALLYLVPGVLGALWTTGLVRGELKQMWKYTEDGSIDTVDVVVDLDGSGNAVKTVGELKDGVVDTTKKGDEEEKKKAEEAKKLEEDKSKKDGHKVFLLSIEVPEEETSD